MSLAIWQKFWAARPGSTDLSSSVLSGRRELLAGAAVFAAMPTAASTSWLAAVIVLGLALLVPTTWQFRLVLLAFGLPEVLGLPWPFACFTAAGACWSLAPTPMHDLVQLPRRRFALWQWSLLAGLGALAGGVVVMIDAARIEAGYTFALPIPPIPPIALLTVLALFAALANATGEELLWRGVLAHFGARETRIALVLTAQAASFGGAHWFGIPEGVFGVLAAAIYSGVVFLVGRRYGFFGALLVHLVTDAVIFCIVVRTAQFSWSG